MTIAQSINWFKFKVVVSVCHVAVVSPVAVRTCPIDGFVAELILTVAIPLLNELALMLLSSSTIVLFVNVCATLVHTIVHDASGTVKVLVCPGDIPDNWNCN